MGTSQWDPGLAGSPPLLPATTKEADGGGLTLPTPSCPMPAPQAHTHPWPSASLSLEEPGREGPSTGWKPSRHIAQL